MVLYFQYDILEIFKKLTKGTKLIKYYKENGRLQPLHRNHIAECIVEYFLSGYGKMEKTDFVNVTEQIVKLFPAELSVT